MTHHPAYIAGCPVYFTGSGIITVEARVLIDANPANVTAREYWLGLSDTTTVTPTNGLFIGFSGLTAGAPFWQGKSISSSVTQISLSTVAAVTNATWTYLKIVVSADGTNVDMYVDNALITSMGFAASKSLFPAFYFRSVSSAAAAAYGMNQDFYKLTYQFTTARI